MDPIIGAALAGGGLSFLGGMFQNQASSAQSLRQMQFQERMSNTAHQRQVADLRKAGLNPILSATSGASSPGGAQAQQINALGAGVSSAVQIRQANALIEKTKAETKLIKDQSPRSGIWATIWRNIQELVPEVSTGKAVQENLRRKMREVTPTGPSNVKGPEGKHKPGKHIDHVREIERELEVYYNKYPSRRPKNYRRH